MMKNYKDISCAILAGGKSRRMNGENKALLKVGEQTNLEKILSFSEGYFKEVIIIANDRSRFEEFSHLPVYSDLISGVGPLGGIHSGLTNSKSGNVFFLPCDMPFLSEELIKLEIEAYFSTKCDIIIPRTGELIEPLHSIFSRKLIPQLEDHLKNTDNYAIRKFFEKADVFYWDIKDSDYNRRAFFNINTHHDLKEANKKLKTTD
jgi:molybdopterin-guanine dinucleotide biosynthesis protein A